MPTRLSESQREALEALRSAYLAEVPARIGAIRRALGEAGRRGDPGAALEDLLHRAHQLVGSSAIFGLARVSAAARAIEDLASRPSPDAPRVEELEPLVAELEAAWRESAPPGDRAAQE